MVAGAFHHAVSIAESNNAQLTVHLVMDPIPAYLDRMIPPVSQQERKRETEAILNKLHESFAERVEIETKITEGTPFLEIIHEVIRNDRDLVVKSAEGTGTTADRLFGTTDMHLLRKCPCPVMLVKSTESTPIRQIMAAVDFDAFDEEDGNSVEPVNRMILELAASLAHEEERDCHVVHAWEAPGEDFMRRSGFELGEGEMESFVKKVESAHLISLERLLRKARDWIGRDVYDAVQPKTILQQGSALNAIPDLVRTLGIDLIVMGTVLRTDIPGLFIGRTAEGILNAIDCSVLAVKPPGFVTPVTPEELT